MLKYVSNNLNHETTNTTYTKKIIIYKIILSYFNNIKSIIYNKLITFKI